MVSLPASRTPYGTDNCWLGHRGRSPVFVELAWMLALLPMPNESVVLDKHDLVPALLVPWGTDWSIPARLRTIRVES